jgi:hypothetical protein
VGPTRALANLRKKLKRAKKEYWLKQIEGATTASEVWRIAGWRNKVGLF